MLQQTRLAMICPDVPWWMPGLPQQKETPPITLMEKARHVMTDPTPPYHTGPVQATMDPCRDNMTIWTCCKSLDCDRTRHVEIGKPCVVIRASMPRLRAPGHSASKDMLWWGKHFFYLASLKVICFYLYFNTTSKHRSICKYMLWKMYETLSWKHFRC